MGNEYGVIVLKENYKGFISGERLRQKITKMEGCCMKKINSKEEAIRVFYGIIQDMRNGFPMNEELMQELEKDWNEVISVEITKIQDKIGEVAIKEGWLSKDEVANARQERDRKKSTAEGALLKKS